MRKVAKLLVLFMVFASCTAEEIVLDENSVENVSTDPKKKDIDPPIETND